MLKNPYVAGTYTLKAIVAIATKAVNIAVAASSLLFNFTLFSENSYIRFSITNYELFLSGYYKKYQKLHSLIYILDYLPINNIYCSINIFLMFFIMTY